MRTAVATYQETEEEKTMREKLKDKVKEKFNQTELAKNIYQTEQFKEYQDFRKEMGQFKEDLRDHLSQSQNPAVIATMTAIVTFKEFLLKMI
jgi:hypothetical protein